MKECCAIDNTGTELPTGADRIGPVIAVAGNPNCGKSTLFNALTGSTQKVGNWPGVTVEKRVGRYTFGGLPWDIVDLPGVYLIGNAGAASQDEKVARDFILSGEADLVVNIIDASNLERNLYLTTQLLELAVPMVVVLNMTDMAEAAGMKIDAQALSQALDCPVVEMVASRNKGREELKKAIAKAARLKHAPVARPVQAPVIEAAIDQLAPRLADIVGNSADPRWVALKLIEGDNSAETLVGGQLDAEIAAVRATIEAETGDEADIVIADGRYRFIGTVMTDCCKHTQRLSASLSQIIDAVVLNRFLGVPIFLFAMYLMFLFTISVGGAFVDFFDQAMGALAVDSVRSGVQALGAPVIVEAVLVGLGSGLQTVSTFIPIIACLFLFLSFLEDSGYMARAAFVMDRAMSAIGLPGKSFVPLIVGFGCNVPAVMATRTLESRRDRIMTVLMAPFMSCGARLPVFALFAAAFFPATGQNIVFGLYLIGLLFAVLTAFILKSTLLTGEASPFVLELPPYHIPTLRTVLIQAWQRLREFIFNAGRVIVPIVMVLTCLAAIGTDGQFGRQNTKDSLLSAASQQLIPIFAPMGLKDENWPAAVGLFTGIFAKEAVVGTLNALYEQAGGAASAAGDEAPATLADKLVAAAETVPTNLAALGGSLLDPLGINVGYVGDTAAAAQELSVNDRVFSEMTARFDGAAGAFAYMLLILLYTPCVAALGAIRHEVGTRWMALSVAWNTGIGYVAAVSFYQAATFADHPASSTRVLLICAFAFAAAVGGMWMAGRSQVRRLSVMPAE
ncbi:Fe(2+) transporter permease subunit FeoB [Oryzibacter oryziterrae]|uniref:Fe(2+) transporter permease subunit FeoB n=1 Tax=Oryzibacter oryziterrae TaxID=2766474 RepID=UPI001F02EA22|nr:Fe(2+) transporter permease subunit FeoB [Oryzibacter oryziterrae]